MTTSTTLSRRTLIRTMAGAGGGLLLGFVLPGATAAVSPPRSWTPMQDGAEINAWLAIDPQGEVTVRVPHSEQGQGGLTSVSMMVAEELDVPWARVRSVFADMNRHVNDGEPYKVTTTHGSQLVRLQHLHIMQAGASARERLRVAAARAWGIAPDAVVAHQGELSAAGHRGSYAEFASAAAAVTLEKEPGIETDPGKWWLLGKATPRVDVPLKVDGRAPYAIDVRLPGMVYAAARSCPVPWGKLVRYDYEAIRNRPGVIAVVEFRARPGKRDTSDLQDGVAVVALDHPAVRESINALVARNITVVTLVSDVPGSKRTHFAGIDNSSAGRTAAGLMGRFLKAKSGKVGLFAGSLSLRDHIERQFGFEQVMAHEFPQYEILPVRESRDDVERTEQLTLQLLNEHPDLVGIYNVGGGTKGIVAGLDSSPRAKDIVFIAHEVTEGSRRALIRGTIDAIINQDAGHEVRSAVRVLIAKADNAPLIEAQERIRIDIFMRDNLP